MGPGVKIDPAFTHLDDREGDSRVSIARIDVARSTALRLHFTTESLPQTCGLPTRRRGNGPVDGPPNEVTSET